MLVLTFNSVDEGLRSAALWVRDHYNVLPGEEVQQRFEKEFKCKVHMNYTDFDHYCKLDFENEHDATIFLLKWL